MKTYHDEVGRGECPQFSSLGWVQIDHRDFVLKAHCYSTPSFGNSSKITGKRISRHSPRWGLKLSAFATETNSADVRAMVAMLPGRRALRQLLGTQLSRYFWSPLCRQRGYLGMGLRLMKHTEHVHIPEETLQCARKLRKSSQHIPTLCSKLWDWIKT